MDTAFGLAQLFMSLAGGYQQASAIRRQGRSEAGVQRRAAWYAEREAVDVIRAGDEAAGQRLAQADQLIGRQRVAAAGQGLDVSAGTPLALQADAAMMGALDADTIRLSAFRQAWGLRMEAADRRAAARNIRSGSRFAARQTIAASFMEGSRGLMRLPSPSTDSKPIPRVGTDNPYEPPGPYYPPGFTPR